MCLLMEVHPYPRQSLQNELERKMHSCREDEAEIDDLGYHSIEMEAWRDDLELRCVGENVDKWIGR